MALPHSQLPGVLDFRIGLLNLDSTSHHQESIHIKFRRPSCSRSEVFPRQLFVVRCLTHPPRLIAAVHWKLQQSCPLGSH
jgi:hypothetical protein